MSQSALVFLAGEGKSELGSRAGHPAYQSDAEPGVLEVLLRRVRPGGWEIGGAREWKSVRNLRAGVGANDTKRVRALALDAREAGCQALAFTRDRDNDSNRRSAIADGIELARADHPLAIVGGVPVPLLEAWILALRGVSRTEDLSPSAAKAKLSEIGVAGAASMADVARTADLAVVPKDAESLREWLATAESALPT